MKKNEFHSVNDLLISADGLQDFLSSFFSTPGKNGKKISFAEFARRGGFSSRSFPRDVLLRKKKITSKSLPGFQRALGLTGEPARLFTLLAALDNPELRAPDTSTEQIKTLLKSYRSKIKLKTERRQHKTQTEIFKFHLWPYVFALLNLENGNTAEEIADRLGIPISQCTNALSEMEQHEITQKRDGRYFPFKGHLIFSEETKLGAFREFYLHTLKKASEQARTHFSNENALFFNSVFSVDPKRIPEVKSALRKVMLDFVDKSIDENGEKTATIVTSFF